MSTAIAPRSSPPPRPGAAHCHVGLDNGINTLIDYARRTELVPGDSPKYFRRLVVEWWVGTDRMPRRAIAAVVLMRSAIVKPPSRRVWLTPR